MSFDNLLFYFHYNLLLYLNSFIRLFCYKLIFYLNIPAVRVRIEAFDNMVIAKLFNTEKGGTMSYTYKTSGTCSSKIELELDGDIVHNVKFTGGCDGNLKAIPALVEGLTVAEIEQKLSGIRCGFKNTSCGDQLAKACRAAYEANRN